MLIELQAGHVAENPSMQSSSSFKMGILFTLPHLKHMHLLILFTPYRFGGSGSGCQWVGQPISAYVSICPSTHQHSSGCPDQFATHG